MPNGHTPNSSPALATYSDVFSHECKLNSFAEALATDIRPKVREHSTIPTETISPRRDSNPVTTGTLDTNRLALHKANTLTTPPIRQQQ